MSGCLVSWLNVLNLCLFLLYFIVFFWGKNGGIVDLGERRGVGDLEGGEGGEVVVWMYCMREEWKEKEVVIWN